MPVDTVQVGSNQRQIFVIGDPQTASRMQNVLTVADATNLAGLFAALTVDVPFLLNPLTNLQDQQRSAVGTIGIAAVNTEGSKPTYAVGLLAFTPAATATDFYQIVGSASKVVRILRISVSGIATAAATVDLQLIKRTSASTGGSPTAATLSQHDSNDSAPTAVVNSFGANPTVGTGAGTLRAEKLNLGAAGAAGKIVWDFTTRNGKGLVLRGVAQSINPNWNGAAVPAGTLLDVEVEFSEE